MPTHFEVWLRAYCAVIQSTTISDTNKYDVIARAKFIASWTVKDYKAFQQENK